MISTSSPREVPLPDHLEDHPAQFTELVSTAIANSQSHDELTRLAEEQAALRRVATLVAQGTTPAEVFEAVIAEVGLLIPGDAAALTRYEADETVTIIGGWSRTNGYVAVGTRHPLGRGTLGRLVFETCRPGRIESYAGASGSLAGVVRDEMGWQSAVGAPIIVEGRLWGVLGIGSTTDRPLPPDTEERLAEFTDLVATAISNAESREQLASLPDEQAALRRVATLAAQGAPPSEIYEAVSAEVAPLVGADGAGVTRYEADGTFTALGGWTSSGGYSVTGRRFALESSVSGLILETRRPSRIDSFEGRPGDAAAAIREMGWRSAMGAPISVEGRLWGVLVVYSKNAEPLPADTERRLGEFTQIVATAIANAEGREEINRLAEEQAALRRVATLVAQGAAPTEVFAAVSAEVARLVPADGAALTRFEDDGTVTALGGWTSSGGYVYVGTRYALEGTVSGLVFETGRPARIDDYADEPGAAAAAGREMGWRSSVGAPITVEGRLWGVLAAVSTSERALPLDTERRLAEFTELVATAIANAESREQLTRLAEEQAALRRIATRVARGAPPAEVFEAVVAEVGRLIPADAAGLSRYELDGTVTATLGGWTRTGGYHLHIGERYVLEGPTPARLVFETRRPARVDGYEGLSGRAADAAREAGWRSTVAAPIIVEGRLWGAIGVASTTDRPLPFETERRLTQFTELLATAIANAESRAELDASRARIVATADATRQRIERDLHDGAQQRLVSLALEVRAAQASVPPELGELRAELSRVVDGHTGLIEELREIAQGIHPATLSDGGLGPALKMLAHRSPVPVELSVRAEGQLPESVEVAAYYVVSEALANVAKHACASVVHVGVDTPDGILRIAVRDDGLGGADPALGSGLLGLKDRAEAIGGTIALESPPGEGTSLLVELPVDDRTR